MVSLSVAKASGAGTGELLLACVGAEGSAGHPYFASDSLSTGPESPRNLADAIHFLCALHGLHPGVIDHAAGRTPESEARTWLIEAGEAMATERLYLTRLAVAAGPAPSTPGGAGSETAVISQRSALGTLAQSDRRGCAIGSALAFACDWNPIRDLLDGAAKRLGIDCPPRRLGTPETLRTVADAAAPTPAVERAMLFGAEQLALQHRALWDLLEARREARIGS